MLRSRALAMGGLLLLLLCSVQAVNFGDDEDDEDVRDVAEAVVASGSRRVSVQGFITNEQFLRLHKGQTIRVFVDDGKYRAIVRHDGSFQVHNVPEGLHFLSVVAPGWHFESVRLEVSVKGEKMRVRAFTNNEMVKRTPLPYPLKLAPSTKLNYFVEREKFNPMTYLKNPMVLMVGFTMIMAFVMPKMTENMDEGEKAKIRDQFNKGPTASLAEAVGVGGGAKPN